MKWSINSFYIDQSVKNVLFIANEGITAVHQFHISLELTTMYRLPSFQRSKNNFLLRNTAAVVPKLYSKNQTKRTPVCLIKKYLNFWVNKHSKLFNQKILSFPFKFAAIVSEFFSHSSIHGVSYFTDRRRHWVER